MLELPFRVSHLPVVIISQVGQLEPAVREMAGSKTIALDTESNSAHRYPEQLCLIQIATSDRIYIVDTITVKEVEPLEEILRDDSIMKIIHGADYDIRCLDRHYGFHINNLYDTSVAARFAGVAKFGLADLVRDLLGVTILKSERLQRADWGLRPLSAEALEYAAADVHHLFALQAILDQTLGELNRTTWVAEECSRLEEVRYAAPNLEAAFLSVKGSQNLDARGLAVLKSLFLFRHEEAQRQHRPPFFVMPEASLTFLAANPGSDISEVPGFGPNGAQRYGRALQQAVRRGLKAMPVSRPPAEAFSPSQIKRLNRLKAWREALGLTPAVDPSLLWPTTSLERLARRPDSISVEIACTNIRDWQRSQFGASLTAFIKFMAP